MRLLPLWILAGMSLVFTACSSPRYASTTEYDDVYFNSSDQTAPLATDERSVQRRDDERSNGYSYDYRDEGRYSERQRDIDSYTDYYYSDDDFHFSRRLRRFDNASTGNWRYYDPFFSNDLYFVMGTPAWNRWNNNGWYNWNNPRFAAPFNPYDPFMARYSTWYRPEWYGVYNSWGSYYSNPWVNAYYGYGPGSFNDPFWGGAGGWGGAWGNPAYCPPGYFRNPYNGFGGVPVVYSSNTGVRNQSPSVTRVRRSTRTAETQRDIRSQAGSATARPTGTTTRTNTSTSTARTSQGRSSAGRTSSNTYLEPRSRTTTAPARVRTESAPARVNTSTRTNTGRTVRGTAPARSNTTIERPSSRNRTYSPGRSSEPRTRTAPATRRNYSPPARTAPSRNYTPSRSSSPSRSTSPSYNRPSSRPSGGSMQRSSSPPSRSSSPRSSGGSRPRGGNN